MRGGGVLIMDKRFLGICIVIASLMLSGTLLYTNLFADKQDRYKVVGARIFDTKDGKYIEANENKYSISTDQETTSGNDYQTLDNSIITYKVSIPGQDGNTSKSIFAQSIIGITASNRSAKYNVKYLEIELKLYKDDVLFLKGKQIIGDKEDISINPLSSYNIDYFMDTKTKYPNKPWRYEVVTKVVKGVLLE